MYRPSVAFLTYDFVFDSKPIEMNGCGYYRCKLPMQELEKFGWDIGLGVPAWNDKHGFGILIEDDKAVHGWDIIVLKLIMMESVANKVLQAKALGQKIVVDLDDALENLEDSNLAKKMTDPNTNKRNNRDHYQFIIDNADALVTSTPFLKEFYEAKGHKNVFMVRNGIDIDRWSPRKDYSGYLPTVGWVGATPWRSKDLEILAPFFGDFLSENKLSFHHSGNIKNAPMAKDQLGVHSDTKTSVSPMKVISQYPELFRKIDIGLVPLNDVTFNHGKSFIKGLEYVAAGVPFVASDLPEYKFLAESGVGLVAKDNDEFQGHLETLLNPNVRKQMAIDNRAIVLDKFSMTQRGHDWNEVYHAIRAI